MCQPAASALALLVLQAGKTTEERRLKVYCPEPTFRVVSRPLDGEDDFWRVNQLLQEIAAIEPPGFVWDVRRWDGRLHYAEEPGLKPEWAGTVHLWETAEGRLVGAVNTDYGDGDAWLQIHPDVRYLEEEMIAWAEENLSAPTRDGSQRQVHVSVFEYDLRRIRVLEQRGYEKTEYWGNTWRTCFGRNPLPEPPVPCGYTMRTTTRGDHDDGQRVADLLNAAFDRDSHVAREHVNFSRLSPSYREHLDLVMEARDGSFAAYVGVPYDEANRRGIFEPVCTHPDHRRRGMASTLMLEAMRRLQATGAADVTVGTGSQAAANALYDSVGFIERYRSYYWRKSW
jgi:ribosomal protein S18 acetylase RimI-like enzyme